MKKKLLSILLAVCLIVALLPLASLAADPVTNVTFGRIRAGGATVSWANFKKGDAPKYLTKDTSDPTKDYVSIESGADATNYTVKLEWPATADKPTLYLKGAVLGGYSATEQLYGTYNFSNNGNGIVFTGDVMPDVVIEADSTIYSFNTALSFAGTATIKSVNGAKLKIATGGNAAANGSIAVSAGESITFDGAVVDMTEVISGAPSIETKDGIDIIIKNGSKLDIATKHRAINAGQSGSTGDIIVTDSTVTVAAGGTSAPGLAAKGDITITNSDVTVNANPASANSTGVGGEISAGGLLTINSGNINITNGRYFGIYSGSNAVINGGKIKVAMKENGGFRIFNKQPSITSAEEVTTVKVGTNGVIAGDPIAQNSNKLIIVIKFDESSASYNPLNCAEITILNTYTITWKNYDGSILSTTDVKEGETPVYNGTAPTKPGDSQYGYAFDKWTPAIVPATGDATYTATFTQSANKYTVTWKNADGTTLETDENVPYGTVPTYDGVTPSKSGTAQYSYSFKGWDVTPAAVTGNVTYTATFNQTVNKYTVTWKNADGTTLETDENVEYGATPAYNGATPTKAADAQNTYSFKGWDAEIAAVTGDVTYTATFNATPVSGGNTSGGNTSGGNTSGGNTSGGNTSGGSTENPKTADNGMVALSIGLLLASTCGIAAVVIGKKRFAV